MGIVETIALTMGIGWASGINVYAAIAVLGFLGSSGHVVLPEQLMVLTDPLVIGAASFMYCIEFFADKTPGVDTGWDTIHTFIRIPAGAILAASAVGDVDPAVWIVAGLLGGTLAAGSHATKAGARVLINTSPEPVTNWAASITEDILVVGGLWTALNYPVVFLVLLAITLVLMIWILPKIWRGIVRLMAKIRQIFAKDEVEPAADGSDAAPRQTRALPPGVEPRAAPPEAT